MEEFFLVSEVPVSLSVSVVVSLLVSVVVSVEGVVGVGLMGIMVAGRFMVGILTVFWGLVSSEPELGEIPK
jgi:hypothetical protein